jgi:hypothetical protein
VEAQVEGESVTIADADLVGSVTLIAVMVTVCCVVIDDGAIYPPFWSSDPRPAGLIVQVTAGLVLLFTVAENCCV